MYRFVESGSDMCIFVIIFLLTSLKQALVTIYLVLYNSKDIVVCGIISVTC